MKRNFYILLGVLGAGALLAAPHAQASGNYFLNQSLTDCAAKAVQAEEDLARLAQLAHTARGQIDTLYLHWTAGSYATAYESYHINIGRCGEVYITCGELTELKPHTWHRNRRAIGLSLDCMSGGAYDKESGQTIWGGQPPTTAQVERLAQVIAVLTRELGLEITPQTVLTHAEAAALDDYDLYSTDPDVRWDLLYLYAPHTDRQEPGGDLLRRLAREERAKTEQTGEGRKMTQAENKAWRRLSHRLDKMVQPGPLQVPGLGVIVLQDGQEVYSHFAGWAQLPGAQTGDGDRAQRGVPFTRFSRFRAASVAKQFTVFTLLQLAEQGRLDLDADISGYLGFSLRNPAFPAQPITVRMLADHTSGLRDGKVYSIPPQVSVQEFFRPQGAYWEDGVHFAPEYPPGEYFCYCNLNYGLLGTIIEAVTGERFDRYQEQHILRQLDIGGKYVPGNFDANGLATLGTVYQKQDRAGRWDARGPWYSTVDDLTGGAPAPDTLALQNPYAPQVNGTYALEPYTPGRNATIFSPQGGLRLSCDELAHAAQMLSGQGRFRGQQVLQAESVRAMQRPHWTYDAATHNGDTYGDTIPCYGLGQILLPRDCPARVSHRHALDAVGHTGEAFGLLSGCFVLPGTPYSFVYLMNGEAVAEDDDPRSAGRLGTNYIWEEKILDAICDACAAAGIAPGFPQRVAGT